MASWLPLQMKTFLFSLCVGTLLAAAAPCGAQQPPVADKTAPFLYVYVAKDAGALPRIVLGLEKPALKISAFANCALVTAKETAKLAGVAAQLSPDDTKTLVAAITRVAPTSEERNAPAALLFFATPDNKALSVLSLNNTAAGPNVIEKGVIGFYLEDQPDAVSYLVEKLHPR